MSHSLGSSPDTSSKSLLGKRGHPDSQTGQHAENDKKNKHDPSLSQSDTYNTDMTETLKNVPKDTSQWTEEILSNFSIKIEKNVSDAHHVFCSGFLHFIESSNRAKTISMLIHKSKEDRAKLDCCEYVMKEVITLDCNCIDNVKADDIKHIEYNMKSSWIDNFVRCTPYSNQLTLRERICRDMIRPLQEFVWQLLYMFKTVQGKSQTKLRDGMYQELFKCFMKLIGLYIVSSPNLGKNRLIIEEENTRHRIFSIPDAIVCHPAVYSEDKICAVVQVTGYSEEKADHCRMCNASRCHATCLEGAPHIGPSIRGQHAGQALCAIPSSVFGDRGIFGIFVQGTNVTFSSFKADVDYYSNLCSRNLQNKEAVIDFSRDYNILKKEDRLKLIHTLFDMGKLLQFLCEKDFM